MSSRVIVLRGDLYSDTGYGRATRALCRLLQDHTRWLFVSSLHGHERRRDNTVSWPLVNDAMLLRNPLFHGAVVIHLCLPNAFIRVPGAFNVGYFFWETAALPSGGFWKAQMLLMDALWAPSHWQSAWLSSVTSRPHVPIIPWPHEASAIPLPSPTEALLETTVYAPLSCDESEQPLSGDFDTQRSARYRDLCESDADLFLAVQTDAPRKGLPLLLSSWMAFKKTPEGRDARLLIKLSSIDVDVTPHKNHAAVSRSIQQARSRFDVTEPDIWLMYARLSPLEMRALFLKASAFVSATMGEGFGGPIVEALLENTPVLAPRHTALCDILEDTYPLIVTSTESRLKLRANLELYSPSSAWHVVDDVSFVDRLRTFVRMPSNERAEIAEQARAHLLADAGTPVVAKAIARALRSYDNIGAAA